jgi:hypothetical protein
VAEEAVVPPSVQAAILIKAAGFDRALIARGRGEIVIGILYQRGVRESLAVQGEFSRALEGLAGQTIADRSLRVVLINWENDVKIAALLSREKIDILYVAPLRSVSISDISATAQALGIRTWSSVPAYVDKGLALGVGIRGDRPLILVNLTAARAEGADLSSQLLKLARLVS